MADFWQLMRVSNIRTLTCVVHGIWILPPDAQLQQQRCHGTVTKLRYVCEKIENMHDWAYLILEQFFCKHICCSFLSSFSSSSLEPKLFCSHLHQTQPVGLLSLSLYKPGCDKLLPPFTPCWQVLVPRKRYGQWEVWQGD